MCRTELGWHLALLPVFVRIFLFDSLSHYSILFLLNYEKEHVSNRPIVDSLIIAMDF